MGLVDGSFSREQIERCLCASVCVNADVWGKVEDKIDSFLNSEHETLIKVLVFAIEQIIQLIRAETRHKSLVKRLIHCSAKCYCF